MDPRGRYDNASVQWAKMRSEYRLKLAERWNRDAYGERPQVALNLGAESLTLDLDLSGIMGGAPREPARAMAEVSRTPMPRGGERGVPPARQLEVSGETPMDVDFEVRDEGD